MGSGELKIDARRKRILELLERDGKVVVSQLSAELGATTVTIRNDLDALERSGYLERIQGGAIPKSKQPSQDPAVSCLWEKQCIAAATAQLIHDGDTLFLNSGTTTREIALALKQHRNLNVVTNSTVIATELSTMPSFRVILLGGELNPQYGFTCGGDAQEQLQKYQADYAILSLDGVSANGGITTYHADEAIIDRLMIERAKQVLIAADHTKIGRAGFSLICPLSKVHALITDKDSHEETMEDIRASGIQVVVA